MTTTATTAAASGFDFLNATGSSQRATATLDASQQNERFLKLLTTQLTHQDPLNPLDNAQMTSQIAQISTVTGVEQLNTTVGKLNTQFVQLQALQGAALVGREVVVPGNRLTLGSDGSASGSFELASAADRVSVEVLNGGGQVVQTVALGAQGSGRQEFSVAGAGLEAGADYRFRVSAHSGSAAVAATPLMRDRVDAVSTEGGTLTLELARGGSAGYDTVKAVH